LTASTLYLLSLGCPKNLIDAEVMAASLEEAGFVLTDAPEKARVILINTCAFILPAREESVEEILSHARFKEAGVGVASPRRGRMPPPALRSGTGRELPEVDLFWGSTTSPLSPAPGQGPGRGAPQQRGPGPGPVSS
jgi:ribosomal protein S12 methylthiotransferase